MSKKVIITSENPTKIAAVKKGFEKMFASENFDFECISVPSDVPEQPMDNDETLAGAENRVRNAKKKIQDAQYWVGIEGGVQRYDAEMEVFAWIVIQSENNIGKSRAISFFLPKKIIELIDEGEELGKANDIIFQQSNSKQKNGAVGTLTGDVITRTDALSDSVILVLIPFKNSEIY